MIKTEFIMLVLVLLLLSTPYSLGQGPADAQQAFNDAFNSLAPAVIRQGVAGLPGVPGGVVAPGIAGSSVTPGTLPVLPPPTGPPPSPPDAITPSDKLALFTSQTEDPQGSVMSGLSALITEDATRRLASRRGRSATDQNVLSDISLFTRGGCFLPPRPTCNPANPYREADGSCNNPNPSVFRGASLTAQARFLPPEYGGDGLGDEPKTIGRSGNPLPSARKVSNELFGTTPAFVSPVSKHFTIVLTHFGQFVDHDIIKTPSIKKPNETTPDPYDEVAIKDCHRDCETNRPECFPIPIPPGDNSFQNEFFTNCLPLVRAKPAPINNCQAGPRQQMNERTSFLDLSSTYGSSENRIKQLRAESGGRLNASEGDLLPFGPKVDDCLSDVQQCFNSGDDRHQEVPMLTVIHIIFLREHNRIARELESLNPHWKDEKLFQETRKILTGIYQHIVYNEFLPLLIGQGTANYFGLTSALLGHRNSYRSDVDPSTVNSFGAAAYRFGHSLVGRFVRSFNRSFQRVDENELREDLFNNDVIRNVNNKFGPTRIGRWMASNFMRKNDRFISDQLRNHLFETNFINGKSNGFDLPAINIQRGRDHGLPGYNSFRQFCGLYPAYVFTNGFFGFRDHDTESVRRLARVYSHPDDVDLFAGGISELPSTTGGILGPTFKCLITIQFWRYKHGDRFFYENPFSTTGFTIAQINDIKRQTLAGIFCRSLHLDYIQRRVFIAPNRQFPPGRIPCSSIPTPNLYLWKE